MERLLKKTMQGRVIIVVDDIERCDEDKAKEFVFFTRAAASLAHCFVLFLTDYDHLKTILSKSSGNAPHNQSEKQGTLYFEKFFNVRIDLPDLDIRSAMESLEDAGAVQLKKELCPDGYQVPSQIYWSIINGKWFGNSNEIRFLKSQQVKLNQNKVNKEKSEIEKEKTRVRNALAQITKERDLWLSHLSNPRSMKKFYQKWNEYTERLNGAYASQDEKVKLKEDDLQDFLSLVQADKVMFFLAYIYVYWPIVYKEIEKSPAEFFEKYQGHPAYNRSYNAEGVDCIDPMYLLAKLGDGPVFSITNNSPARRISLTKVDIEFDGTYIRASVLA